MSAPAHKTYALLRYVPTYGDLPAPVIPFLIVLGAVLVAILKTYGFIAIAIVTVLVRVAYQWNADVFAILRVLFASLAFMDHRRRLHP